MADEQDKPKIHVDADWKAQAQAEKQKLADQAKAKASGEASAAAGGGAAGPKSAAGGASTSGGGGTSGGRSEMPKADFETLLSTMTTQALFAMGAIADPRTGQRTVHLDLARHHIDMLGVIEEKTKGNLTKDESDMLAGTLYELRTRYVQAANAASQSGR